MKNRGSDFDDEISFHNNNSDNNKNNNINNDNKYNINSTPSINQNNLIYPKNYKIFL